MTTTTLPTAWPVEPVEVLTRVIQLLSRCADLGLRPGADSNLTLGLGADLAAKRARALIADVAVHPSEDPAVLAETDQVVLLLAAEELIRQPIELFPPGMSQVMVAVLDLIRETVP